MTAKRVPVWTAPASLKGTALSVRVTPSLNQWQRMHWATRARLQAGFVNELRAEIGALSVRPLQQLNTSVRLTRYSAKELDTDNLVGGAKPLVDAIVAVGLAWDDSPEWLRVEYKQVKCKRAEARTEIEFT